jgi:hypothetical protein
MTDQKDTDGWELLSTDDRGNTIDSAGRIVNDDGSEPHGDGVTAAPLDKHTPGPWMRLTARKGHTHISNAADKHWAAADHYIGEVRSNNAALITAAPELLAALREVQARYASVSEHGAIEVAITPELHTQIERALTRAVHHTRDVDERPAEDDLSAAAPDLLKAGQALTDKIAAYGLPPEYLIEEWRALRSAIAKAQGQGDQS